LELLRGRPSVIVVESVHLELGQALLKQLLRILKVTAGIPQAIHAGSMPGTTRGHVGWVPFWKLLVIDRRGRNRYHGQDLWEGQLVRVELEKETLTEILEVKDTRGIVEELWGEIIG
jgi:hypothetical protein